MSTPTDTRAPALSVRAQELVRNLAMASYPNIQKDESAMCSFIASLEAEVTRISGECDAWERKSKNNGLAAAIAMQRVEELEAKFASLHAESET